MQTPIPVQFMFLWTSAKNTQKECMIGIIMTVFPSEATERLHSTINILTIVYNILITTDIIPL